MGSLTHLLGNTQFTWPPFDSLWHVCTLEMASPATRLNSSPAMPHLHSVTLFSSRTSSPGVTHHSLCQRTQQLSSIFTRFLWLK